MANTSASGGYLTPAVLTPPAEGLDLDKLFQGLVVGITGLDGTLVRPRWQPVVPKSPERDTNWCALGVVDQQPDAGPFLRHNPNDGLGTDTLLRHERLTVLFTFYGPQAGQYAAMLRDGLSVPQNLEAITAAGGIKLRDSTERLRRVPELINEQWFDRFDYTVVFVRQIDRTYGVQNLVAVDTDLYTDVSPIHRFIHVDASTPAL